MGMIQRAGRINQVAVGNPGIQIIGNRPSSACGDPTALVAYDEFNGVAASIVGRSPDTINTTPVIWANVPVSGGFSVDGSGRMINGSSAGGILNCAAVSPLTTPNYKIEAIAEWYAGGAGGAVERAACQNVADNSKAWYTDVNASGSLMRILGGGGVTLVSGPCYVQTLGRLNLHTITVIGLSITLVVQDLTSLATSTLSATLSNYTPPSVALPARIGLGAFQIGRMRWHSFKLYTC